MIMTEEKAGEKRCPLNSITVVVAKAINFDSMQADIANGVAPSVNCCGSRCALWAWYDYANEKGETFVQKTKTEEDRKYFKGRSSPVKTEAGAYEARPARGFCGLTGGPRE